MKKLFWLCAFVTISAAQAENATYYRVWRGYKKSADVKEFLNVLPPFMTKGLELYQGRGLSNYLVSIPPADLPAHVPDEFALIAMSSEDAYKKVRETAEGKAYGDSHWELFDQKTSVSAPYEIYDLPDGKQRTTLAALTAYNIIGKPVDWSKGVTSFFLGTRRPDLTADEYLRRLNQHVALVRQGFEPKGMLGYIVLVSENYEVAYINWPTADLQKAANESEVGKKIFNDANEIMDIRMWMPSEGFDRKSVEQGHFYSTVDEKKGGASSDK